MKQEELIARILQDAQTITKLTNDIKQTCKDRAENVLAWQDACRIFHDTYNDLAFPGGLDEGIALLKNQDPNIITTAIAYLKADPRCFRSGYVKEKIGHLLKAAPLTNTQIAQLHDILIAAIHNNGRREYREYCKLARTIADDTFRARIHNIIKRSENTHVIRQAQWMLDTLK
jgi:hypothetical protein